MSVTVTASQTEKHAHAVDETAFFVYIRHRVMSRRTTPGTALCIERILGMAFARQFFLSFHLRQGNEGVNGNNTIMVAPLTGCNKRGARCRSSYCEFS